MRRKACVVATTEITIHAFLVPQLRAMGAMYDLTVAVQTPNPRLLAEIGVDGNLVQVPMAREIAPWRDLVALLALCRLMRGERFDLVHSITPKAGLLAMTASWLARVPVRIHTFTGQVWATRTGPMRVLLRAADLLVVRLATLTLADSRSQREFLIREGIVSPAALVVLGAGSVAGVDTTRFRPDAATRQRLRQQLGIAPADVVLLFVGRLTRDKGVLELATAFATIAAKRDDVQLLMVGPDEGRLRPSLAAICGRHADRMHFVEFTPCPEQAMAVADVLCLPSHREGFGSVIIEAAAAGLPAVASRIYGIVDAIEEGRTGLLHRPGDVGELTSCLLQVVEDGALRQSFGTAARHRAERDFSPTRLTRALLELYGALVEGRTAGLAQTFDGMPVAERPSPVPHVARRSSARRDTWYERGGKRVLDVVVAGFLLVALLPLFALLAVAIRTVLGAPVLFRQVRPGRLGTPFVLVKFRSMTDRYDGQGNRLPDEERLTRFGRFLRASSLDELPELWNVLAGHMSLVGPRPLLLEYLPRYSARQAGRHAVRPGITGLAQVSGRNALTWDERFELDLRYVDACSLWLDLQVLARTAVHVIARRGISQPGHATSQEFVGVEGR